MYSLSILFAYYGRNLMRENSVYDRIAVCTQMTNKRSKKLIKLSMDKYIEYKNSHIYKSNIRIAYYPENNIKYMFKGK